MDLAERQQRKQRITRALKHLKTVLIDKRVEIDQNAFRMLLFRRLEAEAENCEVVEVIPSTDEINLCEKVAMTKQKCVITLEELQESLK